MSLDLSSRLVVRHDVKTRELSGEMVLMDLKSGTYYGLDAVGARIWALAGEGYTLAQVCDVLLVEYDVTRDQVEQDVLNLAQALVDNQLGELAS